MKEYKRLTMCGTKFSEYCLKTEKCKAPRCFECDIMLQMFQRLGELEDKITLKKLFIVPCKVGQQVYVDGTTFDYYGGKKEYIKDKLFYVAEIMSFIINKKQFLMKIKFISKDRWWVWKTQRYPISAIGKTVFLTKFEAEAKLKELQNEHKSKM